jgi:hypothetical protein
VLYGVSFCEQGLQLVVGIGPRYDAVRSFHKTNRCRSEEYNMCIIPGEGDTTRRHSWNPSSASVIKTGIVPNSAMGNK